MLTDREICQVLYIILVIFFVFVFSSWVVSLMLDTDIFKNIENMKYTRKKYKIKISEEQLHRLINNLQIIEDNNEKRTEMINKLYDCYSEQEERIEKLEKEIKKLKKKW